MARTKLAFAVLLLLAVAARSRADEPGGPWGKPVDGLACRLVVQPAVRLCCKLGATTRP